MTETYSGLDSLNTRIDSAETEIINIKGGSTEVPNATNAKTFGSITSITENYTTKGTENEVILADATSAAITITITTATNIILIIKKVDDSANAIDIVPDSGTIDGATSLSLTTQYEVVRIVCDGTNWWKI